MKHNCFPFILWSYKIYLPFEINILLKGIQDKNSVAYF